MEESTGTEKNIIKIDEAMVKNHLNEIVRGTVEETLNSMLDAEADALVKAERYQRSPERATTRAGHYRRKLMTSAGEVTLKMPKLRTLPFDSAIIRRYQRREISVEEALVEMYLAGVSVRKVEDITQKLWGHTVSPSTISELNKKIYGRIDAWRERRLEGTHPYVFMDGIFLKMTWGGEVRNVAVLVAVGVRDDGFREVLGVQEGAREDKESWTRFLRHLKDRGLQGVQLVVSDACAGLKESLPLFFSDFKWQRCVVHFYRNVFTSVPKSKVREVAAMLKAIHAQESRSEAAKKAVFVETQLREMKLKTAADIVRDGIADTLAYMDFPSEHWRSLKTNNPLERVLREVRRRTRVVGAFPDTRSAIMLTAARLRYLTQTKWGTRKYLDIEKLRDKERHTESA